MARRNDALLVLFSEQEKRELADLAERDGRTMGALIRHLVAQYRNQQQALTPKAA